MERLNNKKSPAKRTFVHISIPQGVFTRKFDPARRRDGTICPLSERLMIPVYFIGALIVVGSFWVYGNMKPAKAEEVKLITAVVTPRPTPTATPIPEPVTDVEKEIKLVFGSHYQKAMLLLKGDGKGTCSENHALNPEALNDNTKWGGVGKDWGVFQINDKWQGVSNTAFLKDPAINIRIAWNIYKRSGYSFKLWTCGKVYGI